MPKRGAWLAWAGIVVLYAVLRVPLLDVPLDRDEGAFGVVAQGMWRGEMPYRDLADHKPPGIFLIYALAVAVFPPTAMGLHLFLALWNFGTLLLVAALARRWSGRDAAGCWAGAAFAYLSATPAVQGFTCSSEMLMLLPICASLWCADAALEQAGRGRTWRLLASGAFGAAACWIKQPAAFSVAPALGLLMFCGGAERKDGLRACGWWLAGGVGFSALLLAPFVAAGVGADLWYWSFAHNLNYGGLASSGLGRKIWERFVQLAPGLGPALLIGVPGCIWRARQGGRPRAWMGPVCVAGSILGAFISPHLYQHYFAQLLPAFAVAAGIGCAALPAIYAGWPRTVQIVAAILLVLPGALAHPSYWFANPAAISVRRLGPHGFEAGPMVARYLKDRTRPEDAIFIYGSEPQVAFQAERPLANPFVMLYPLTFPFPRQREFQERTWRELERRTPAYILVQINNSRSTLVTPATDPWFGTQLNGLVQSRYELESVLLMHPQRGYKFVTGLSADELNQVRDFTHFLMFRRKNLPAATSGAP